MAYQTTTLAQLKTMLASKYDSVPFWTPEEARIALNEGLRVWNAATGFWRNRITLLTIPDDNYMPIPGNLAYKTRVEFNGRPLAPTTFLGLDAGRPSWEGESSDLATVPTAPVMWAAISVDLIVIWPADGTGNNTLTLDGVAAAPVLINDGDFIDLGDEELNQLLGYALHVLAFKFGGDLFLATQPLYKSWLQAAADRNAQLKVSNLFRKVMNQEAAQDADPTAVDVPGPN